MIAITEVKFVWLLFGGLLLEAVLFVFFMWYIRARRENHRRYELRRIRTLWELGVYKLKDEEIDNDSSKN